MACNINTRSKHRLSMKLAAGIALSAMFAFGVLSTSASAQERWGAYRGYNHAWNGGYYRAPPVVYGSPYGRSYYGTPYYAPPVIYGPGVNVQIW